MYTGVHALLALVVLLLSRPLGRALQLLLSPLWLALSHPLLTGWLVACTVALRPWTWSSVAAAVRPAGGTVLVNAQRVASDEVGSLTIFGPIGALCAIFASRIMSAIPFDFCIKLLLQFHSQAQTLVQCTVHGENSLELL